MKFKIDKSGFTLIESIIAIGVFSVLSVMLAGIFVNANNLHKNTVSLQRLQNEGRYILEKLAKEIRGRDIDYDFGGIDFINQTNLLPFKKDEQGKILVVSYDATNKNLLYLDYNDLGMINSQAALNASDVALKDVKFYVSPTSDPVADLTIASQPRVTIVLILENRGLAAKYQKELTLQTTISSKVYDR